MNNCWRKATTYSMSAGSLAGLVMRSAGKLDEAARPLLLITVQPLAHGEDGDLKQTSGGLDAMLTSVSDEAQAMVVGTFISRTKVK